jgi:hypothetical protein
LFPQGLKPNQEGALTAALKRCATQNQDFSMELNGAAKSRAPSKQGQNPKRSADVESHPNVEKHDVRMGHPLGFLMASRKIQRGQGCGNTENCALLISFLPWLPPIICAKQPVFPALEEVMEELAELMQRLLEIQSGGRQRRPEPIAEDERLRDGLRKRSLAGKPLQTVRLSQDSPERMRFEA